jgi:hypothetical protein
MPIGGGMWGIPSVDLHFQIIEFCGQVEGAIVAKLQQKFNPGNPCQLRCTTG